MSFGELLAAFKTRKALVLGDLMLDEYIFGRATRISQEAPVMVVRQISTQAVPGGAANVAKNLVAYGAQTSLAGVIGTDLAGEILQRALRDSGIAASTLVADQNRPTTRKLRVLANHSHQVLRIDHEDDSDIGPQTEQEILKLVEAGLQTADVLLISDYHKGCVTSAVIEGSIARARHCGVPVVANAKPNRLSFYRGASLVSMNQYEASVALGLDGGMSHEIALNSAKMLRDSLGVERILITLGASGMVAAGATSYEAPAVKVEVYDEAGAGDTVIATLALAISSGHFGNEALSLAAHAAAAVVQRVGVATPTSEDLQRIGAIDKKGT